MNTDGQLLRLYFDKSDKKALETLFSRHYPAVYQAVLHLVHNSFDANDITQATFLKVIQSGRSFEPYGSFRNWILSIAVNEVRQFKRNAKRRMREDWLFDVCARPEAGGERAVTEDLSRREFEQKLELALEEMPSKLKEPMVLHYYEGLSHAEAGMILGLSKSTVQFRLKSAVGRLRKFFRNNGCAFLIPLIADYFPQSAAAASVFSIASGKPLAAHLSHAAGKLWIGALFMKANQNILILLAVLLLVGGGAALKLASSPDEGPPDESPLFPDSFEAKKSAGGGFLEDKSLYAASEERIPVLPAVKRLEICRPIIFPEAVSFRGGSWSAQP